MTTKEYEDLREKIEGDTISAGPPIFRWGLLKVLWRIAKALEEDL